MHSAAHPMTEGSIAKHLIRFCIPAILGDLFQVTYNTVDSVIVGRYAGASALAAVGVANPLMNIALFFIIGIGIGSSVLMSEFYGAGDYKKLQREFSTTMIAGFVLGVLISIGLFFLAERLLVLCRTPIELFAETLAYLRIVAIGSIMTALYNVFSAAFRSVGNTRTPLICLIIGSSVNIFLDMLFVAKFQWGGRYWHLSD